MRGKNSKNPESGLHPIVRKLHVPKWAFPKRLPADPTKTVINNFLGSWIFDLGDVSLHY